MPLCEFHRFPMTIFVTRLCKKALSMDKRAYQNFIVHEFLSPRAPVSIYLYSKAVLSSVVSPQGIGNCPVHAST